MDPILKLIFYISQLQEQLRRRQQPTLDELRIEQEKRVCPGLLNRLLGLLDYQQSLYPTAKACS